MDWLFTSSDFYDNYRLHATNRFHRVTLVHAIANKSGENKSSFISRCLSKCNRCLPASMWWHHKVMRSVMRLVFATVDCDTTFARRCRVPELEMILSKTRTNALDIYLPGINSGFWLVYQWHILFIHIFSIYYLHICIQYICIFCIQTFLYKYIQYIQIYTIYLYKKCIFLHTIYRIDIHNLFMYRI